MKKSKARSDLEAVILLKESELLAEGTALKAHFYLTYESLKPANILRSTLKEVFLGRELKTNMVNSVIGIGTGFIARKIFTGKSDNVLKKFAGVVIEMLVASNVTMHADDVKAVAGIIIQKIKTKFSDKDLVS